MIDPLAPAALTTGLLGWGHCLGMCGGLVTALSFSPDGRRGGPFFHLFYNVGRIVTYTGIGLLVGWIGSAIAFADSFRLAGRLLLIGSDLFVILVGFGTAGLFSGLNVARLEFPGPMKTMTGAVQGLRRLPPPLAAFPLGLMFGLLPCGYLYAVAITAAQSADPWRGAQIMFAFGLGTVPALFLFGSAAQWMGSRFRKGMLRLAGLTVALMGFYNLFRHLRMMGMF